MPDAYATNLQIIQDAHLEQLGGGLQRGLQAGLHRQDLGRHFLVRHALDRLQQVADGGLGLLMAILRRIERDLRAGKLGLDGLDALGAGRHVERLGAGARSAPRRGPPNPDRPPASRSQPAPRHSAPASGRLPRWRAARN